MKKTALTTLIELATGKRDAAAVALARLLSAQTASQAQLDALLAYRQEYAQRLSLALSEGVTVHRLNNDQRFLLAIDQAIVQQREVLASHTRRVAYGKTNWREQERRVQSFDTLAKRRQADEMRRVARLDQRQTDEFASRAAQRACA